MNYKLTIPNAKCPSKKDTQDAAYDLYTPIQFVLYRQEVRTIDTGFACELPEHYYAQILGRSKLASKGVVILGGVIDNGYRGSWGVVLTNLGTTSLIFNIGDAIAQFVIQNIMNIDFTIIDELQESKRGEKGIWTQ